MDHKTSGKSWANWKDKKSVRPEDLKGKVKVSVRGRGIDVYHLIESSVTPKAVDCLRYILEKVYLDFNREGLVDHMNPETQQIETVPILKLLKAQNVDLNEQGYMILNVRERSDGSRVPRLAIVDKRKAIKVFSDQQAMEKSVQMASMSRKFANIHNQNKSKKASQEPRFVKISWGIADGDLAAKKKFVIESALAKSGMVYVVLDLKSNLSKIDDLDSLKNGGFRKEKVDDLDVIKREKTVELLRKILEEDLGSDLKIAEKGDIRGRFVFEIKARPSQKAQEEPAEAVAVDTDNVLDIDLNEIKDKKLLKELKRKQRQEKHRLREMKKGNV